MTVSKMNALLKKLGNNSLIKVDAVSTTFLELLLLNAGSVNFSYFIFLASIFCLFDTSIFIVCKTSLAGDK